MNRHLTSAAVAAAALLFTNGYALAQVCYDQNHQCFTFGPPPGSAKFDTGLALGSEKLSVGGDIRFRLRAAETPSDEPYNHNDQIAMRARLHLGFQVTEQARLFVEYNFSETWAGSAGYSDAQPGENNNDLAQAYVHVDDMLGFGDNWRIGRSTYVLANGLILGACDFLQYPSTFTGVWLSKTFAEKHHVEVFGFDDYGPLHASHAGVRYAGATGRIGVMDQGVLERVDLYYLAGTREGDAGSKDSWMGVEFGGTLPAKIHWRAEFAQRNVDMGDDITAYRLFAERKFEDCFIDGVSLTRTDSEGAMHINPADYNSAGLLHQYGGAWRSDLDTNQLGISFAPIQGLNLDLNVLSLDRDGLSPQQGELEVDLVASKQLKSGLFAWAGYGIDDEERQVLFAQLTLSF